MRSHHGYAARIAILITGALLLPGCEDLPLHDATSLISPHLKRSEIVGFVAGLGTTFAALPDLIAMLKRRSSAGMNPRMTAIIAGFQLVWIWYGMLIGSRPIIVWNVIGVAINSLSVGANLHFARKTKAASRTAS